MSSSSESAEAVLATVIAARRRIDHLTTRYLPAQRALAFEINRTVGASREREQVMMLSGILDRRLEMIRGGLSQPASPTPPRTEPSPSTPTAERSPEPSSPRGLRTIPLNGGDPDDVTLTDSDRVRLILDAEDLDAEELRAEDLRAGERIADLEDPAERRRSPVLDDEDDIPLGDGGQEEDTVEHASPETVVEETAVEDDIAWVVDGRRPPGFDDNDHSPPPAQSADPNSFLNALEDIQVEEHSALSPEDELDRLVLQDLERARAELVLEDLERNRAEQALISEEPARDDDEDADIRHLLTDESDLSDSDLSDSDLSDSDLSDSDLSNSDLSNSDLSNSDLSDSDLSDSGPSDPSDSDLSNSDPSDSDLSDSDPSNSDPSGLVSDGEVSGDEVRTLEDENSSSPAVEDFSHLVIDDDERLDEVVGGSPSLVYTEASSPLVFDEEATEYVGDNDHDSLVIDDSDDINLDNLVIDDGDTADDISLDDDDISLVSAHVDSGSVHAPSRSVNEGLEESTILMDSSELSRRLAAETAPPRAISARMPLLDEPEEDDELEQPRGAAIQLLGTGQARTLGHTLELESAEEEDDFADEWDSDEDSEEVISTGELSISFEEEYEDEPIIPQLTESPSVSPATPEAVRYEDQIDEDDIARGLAQAREVEAHGDLQNAIILYGDVIDLDPTSAEARMGRGRCTMELGDYAAAISDFQRAEDLNPTSAEPAQGMGDLFYARKDYSRAIEFYTQAINLDAAQVLARVRRGMCFYYKKNNQKALVDLERAYAMDPTIPGLSASISQVSKAIHRR
ncbi:MAG: tetratricopeptide repeat protein [Myxococcota bacterium]|nr:tetratricopeptide repeat protein [Myxococcota bacterium]